MDEKKKSRIERARLEARERQRRAISSLIVCFGRCEVMRHHHDLLVVEMHDKGGIAAFESDSAKTRFITYVSNWFAGLSSVIERYQQLQRKGTIPRDDGLDSLLTEDRLSLVKPFRNAVAHCSEYDDARVLQLLGAAETLPDWAEEVSKRFRHYLTTNSERE